MTTPPVTSEPVPAVVGIVTSGIAARDRLGVAGPCEAPDGAAGSGAEARALGGVQHGPAADGHDGVVRPMAPAAASTDAIVGSPGATTRMVVVGASALATAGSSATAASTNAIGRRAPSAPSTPAQLAQDTVAEAHAHRQMAGEGLQRMERHGA